MRRSWSYSTPGTPIPGEGAKRCTTVSTIKDWGDEAYASTVFGYATVNNFAVRKGKVSVVIISTAEYKEIRNLMKAVLAKL